ncbi:MAG: M48 family metalloprotease [Methyloprofundus sp.]|nr:M48 family metalloprotease [Methyloprofundus sp.]
MTLNKTSLTIALSALIIFNIKLGIAADIILPDLGDSTGRLISPAQEAALGDSFFRSIRNQLNISYDPDIQAYIQTIGQNLVAHSDNPTQPFYFFVVESDDINAFAGPGGYIGINSGLILNSDSESELASVMAHEIAHVTQRHIYRSYEAAKLMSIPAAAAMIAAIVIATQAPEVGIGALSAIQAGSIQMQIDFTRDNEQEADRIGLQTLARAEFDPRSMPAFFEKLQHASRYYGAGAPEFLRTHPITSSRISDTRGRAETFPYRQVPNSQDYRLAKAKLRLNSKQNNLADVITYFRNRSDQGTQQQRAAMQYGLGLAYVMQQKFTLAKRIFQQLVKQYPEQVQYLTALAQLAVDQRDTETAKKLYLQLYNKHPDNVQFKFEYIAILLKSHKNKQALQELKLIDYHHQQYPQFFKLLARAYGNLKQNIHSHRYMAEYYYVIGQTNAAILQIKIAQKEKNINFHLSAILEDRLTFFADELQALRELEDL